MRKAFDTRRAISIALPVRFSQFLGKIMRHVLIVPIDKPDKRAGHEDAELLADGDGNGGGPANHVRVGTPDSSHVQLRLQPGHRRSRDNGRLAR